MDDQSLGPLHPVMQRNATHAWACWIFRVVQASHFSDTFCVGLVRLVWKGPPPTWLCEPFFPIDLVAKAAKGDDQWVISPPMAFPHFETHPESKECQTKKLATADLGLALPSPHAHSAMEAGSNEMICMGWWFMMVYFGSVGNYNFTIYLTYPYLSINTILGCKTPILVIHSQLREPFDKIATLHLIWWVKHASHWGQI